MKRVRLLILASFGVAILVVIVGWAGAGIISAASADRARAAHRRQIIDAAHELENGLLDSESAVRGYLLTGDVQYLGPYEERTAAGDPTAPLLRLLTPEERASPAVRALVDGVRFKQAEMHDALARYRTGGATAALRLLRYGDDLSAMQSVREIAGHLLDEHSVGRDRLERDLEHSLATGQIIVLGGTLVAFALAVLVNLGLVRAVSDREQALIQLEHRELELRQKSQALIAHEHSLARQLAREQALARQLKRSNEELDQFAYAASHDLKAPLRAITNLAAWLEEDLAAFTSPASKENFALIRSRARRLELLIDGILAYSRAGRATVAPETVSVGKLVADLVDLAPPPPGVAVDIDAQLPTLRTEKAPLQQVFMNLLQNSIKHGCAGGGRVQVSASPDGPATWQFTVRDDGPGIDKRFHERIFGIFQTLASRDRVEGSGIGLAVVRKLVEGRGGNIRVESEPGRGAAFIFTWPISPVEGVVT